MITEDQYEQILESVKYSCGDQVRTKILESIKGSEIGLFKGSEIGLFDNEIDEKVSTALGKVVEDLLGDHIIR